MKKLLYMGDSRDSINVDGRWLSVRVEVYRAWIYRRPLSIVLTFVKTLPIRTKSSDCYLLPQKFQPNPIVTARDIDSPSPLPLSILPHSRLNLATA